MKRTAVYGVAYQEETGPVGSYIPTLGYPTSAADMYRVGAIEETGHEGWNSCYTDVHTCNSLARLIEGPIKTRADLQDVETALQLLMWHDRVVALKPWLDGEGFVNYGSFARTLRWAGNFGVYPWNQVNDTHDPHNTTGHE